MLATKFVLLIDYVVCSLTSDHTSINSWWDTLHDQAPYSYPAHHVCGDKQAQRNLNLKVGQSAMCCFTIDKNAYKISCVNPNIVSFQHQSVERGQMHLGFILSMMIVFSICSLEWRNMMGSDTFCRDFQARRARGEGE